MRRYPRLSNVSLAFLEACCRCESALCHTARLDWLRYCTASVAGLTCPPPPHPPLVCLRAGARPSIAGECTTCAL